MKNDVIITAIRRVDGQEVELSKDVWIAYQRDLAQGGEVLYSYKSQRKALVPLSEAELKDRADAQARRELAKKDKKKTCCGG